MKRSAAAAHLSEVCLAYPADLTASIEGALAAIRTTVANSLHRTPAPLPRHNDVTAYIEKKRRKQDSIDDNIRQRRLRDALRLKQELEGRLTAVSQSIKRLSPEPTRSSPRLDLRQKDVRQQFLYEESERRKEASDIALKFRRDQQDTMRRRQQRQREEEERERCQSLEEQRKKEEEDRKQAEERSKHLAEIEESIRKRKDALIAKRQLDAAERERLREQTYANEKLLVDFHRRVLLPIEQERAEVLSRKKQLHHPISREEIEAHSKKHDEELRLLAAQKQAVKEEKSLDGNSFRTSKFTQVVVQQAKKEKREREEEEAAKLKMLEKRKKYGELVMSFFQPTVDPMKQKELEMLKERTKTSPKTTKANSKSESPIPFRPRKFKPNPLLPPPPRERRSPSPLDFLAEQRRRREKYETERLPEDAASYTIAWDMKTDGLPPSEAIRRVQTKALTIERESQRKALLLSHVNPANAHAIEIGERLNDAMIESIKAKLSVITDIICTDRCSS